MIQIKSIQECKKGAKSTTTIAGNQFTVFQFENGNRIIGTPKLFEKSAIRFQGENSTVIIHPEVSFIKARLDLKNKATINIGGHSKLMGNLLAHHSCSIQIGERLKCNGELHIRTAEGTTASVGSGCLVARATLRTSDMHPIYDLDSNERLNQSKDIQVGDKVWFGQDCFLSKGVTIGDGSIIAAFAVVTKDVPPHSIAAGNPARIVKERIKWGPHLDFSEYI